jgi:5'-phosphate synthase pdxT subunit|tara:strand:+ start:274 stop:885 length:612 start_codon:yes stop_codon:yes gene_type:complete
VSNIGVLELQGNYSLHHKIFSDLGISSKGIKTARDLDNIDGLVIPGGESTTISLLLDSFDLRIPIKNFAKENPIMGTCAGLIMMSKSIKGDKKVTPLGILDIIVDRNAYGRQIMSCKEPVSFRLNNQKIEINATLIRAPKIISINDSVNVLATIDNFPAVVMEGKHLGLSFHPELDGITIFHEILFNPSCKFYWPNLNKVNAA